jgi:hypothetical protein
MKRTSFAFYFPLLIACSFIVCDVFLFWGCKRSTQSPVATTNTKREADEPPPAPSFELTDKALVGIWQPSPIMASGWEDTYSFFPDHRFIYRPDTMNCEKRLVSENGEWKLVGSTLTLSKTKRTRLEGGHLEPAMGSCASDHELEDAHEVSDMLSPPETNTISVSTDVPEGYRWRASIMMGKTRFWKWENDPNNY